MASQQFCLKWNNHTNNMLTIFENLLSTEAFVDVTLACDGLSLKAHKMVLSACSPFFQSLFLENPCKHPIVIMKDMNYKDLKAIIDFMYHGEVNVSQDQLSALLKTAETLKVKGLAEVGGENRQATSGLVQQEVVPSQQNSIPIPTSSSTPQPSTQQRRVDSPPLHGKRKRGRPRKRSLSDSNRSDDEMVPTKIKEPDSPEIEELSGDASMEGVNNDMLRQGSNSSQGPMHSSVNSFSSKHARSNAQVEEVPSGEENEFEVEPSKLLEQTLTTDNVPSMSNAASSSSVSSGNFNLPSSSGMEISTIGMSGDAQALVPVSATSDSLSSSHLQGPDSPQDIKPAILTFEDPPLSPSAGTSQSMVYMDQSSLPGPSSYQDNSLVQHDAQPQALSVIKPFIKSECQNYLAGYGYSASGNVLVPQRSGGNSHQGMELHYSTDRLSNPTSQILTHTGEKPSECANSCTDIVLKDFNDPKALVKCVYQNYSEPGTSTSDNVPVPKKNAKLYQCVECPYSTDRVSKLTRHNLTHTGEKPFECFVCFSRFARKDKLEKHVRTHTGEKPFHCLACNRQFTKKEYLIGHKCKNNFLIPPLPQ